MEAFLDAMDERPTTVNVEKDHSPPAPSPLKMDQSPDILMNIREREVPPQLPHSMEGKTDTPYGRDYQFALEVSPSLRNEHIEYEHTTENSLGVAIWESMKRDSFIGNVTRWIDNVSAEMHRNRADEKRIWDYKDELTHGISPEYHRDIVTAPTWELAIRESQRIRHREEQLKREYNQSFGKSLVADALGFMLDPSNLLPGYGMLKGVQLANRASTMSTLGRFAQSTKMQKMGSLAAAGAFEEAVRMAPRYASDPTFEANEYYAGIAMSAAMSGLMPAAFSVGRSGVGRLANKIPEAAADIRNSMHAHGVDVAVRQAMSFPSALKETGFKDPGTALRKSKEAAQDKVSQKVNELNARSGQKEFEATIKDDLSGESPTTSKAVQWMESKIDQAGDAAIERMKLKAKRTAQGGAAVAAGTVVAGPLGGVAAATLFANRDWIQLAGKAAVRARNKRRLAYDAAISAGDKEGAARILREARTTPRATAEQTLEIAQEEVASAVENAKKRIREIHNRARACA